MAGNFYSCMSVFIISDILLRFVEIFFHTKHINTLCGQNLEFLNIILVVHIVTTGLITPTLSVVQNDQKAETTSRFLRNK